MMPTADNLTGLTGLWSAAHPWRAIGLWLAFVVAALASGSAVGSVRLHDGDQSVGESARAMNAIAAAFPRHASENILVRANSDLRRDPAYRAAVADVVDRVTDTGLVTDLRSPLDGGNDTLITRDGTAALVTFDLIGTADEAAEHIDPVLRAVSAASRAHPGFDIREAGEASITRGISDTTIKDLHAAEKISVPLALLVLLVTFGAVVAALLPLALALTAIAAATGLVALASHLSGVDESSSSVMLLIGLAVGVDYSMFYVKRQREERAAGRSTVDAVAVAAATSGRSVLISGVTVLVALCGMFLTGSKIFVGMAEATVLVVATAVIGSLTVLPALLSLLGDRVDRGSLPLLGPHRRRTRPPVWGWIIERAARRPIAALVFGGAALVGLALPALSMHTATPGATDLPHDVPVVQTYELIQRTLPGSGAPAIVAVSAADVTAPAVASATDAFIRMALGTGAVHQPVAVRVAATRTVATITLPLAGRGDDATSIRALQTLRDRVIPATIGRVDGARADVTGMTAVTRDFNALMHARAPIVFAFVLALAFVLLLLSFRSLVIAVKAIVLNLLSVFAAYGLLVVTFQWGWGEQVLDFRSTGAITSWLPLFLFVVLFSLSMDYHVFILSRVREAYDQGMPTRRAIERGITSTAGVVTAAAAVMVMTFAVFATLSFVPMKELGVGLAAAVLLDATIVRGVVLPSAMTLLGDRNWYLPRWLDWLPAGSPARSEPGAATTSEQPLIEELVAASRR